MSTEQTPPGPPYPPTNAGLGLQPTTTLDDPIIAVFMLLFIFGAVMHMTIFQVNMRRGKKFIMSGMTFGFCMARITACVMRLVWSTHVTNVSIAIAAQVFVAAGVVLLFIINLIFAQRILRASHPGIGWTKWFSWAFILYYASIVAMLIALVVGTVQSFFTLDGNIKRIDRDIQLVGSTYFAVAAFMPFPLMALNYLLPRNTRVEKFGSGRFRSKIVIVLFASFVLTLGAAFRAGIGYVPRPVVDPAWYHSKACFYVANFTIDIIVVYMFALVRVDKRFHVPNGSKGPGDYSKGAAVEASNKEQSHSNFIQRLNTEEDFFDEEDTETAGDRKKKGDIEANLPDSKPEE